MFIVLNGPLGIGKSTLAEALAESIDQDLSSLTLVVAPVPRVREGDRLYVSFAHERLHLFDARSGRRLG